MSHTINTSRHIAAHQRSATLQSIELGASATHYEPLEIATIEELIEVEALHQPLLGRNVLVKRLTADGNALARVRRAFLQEVRAMAMLRHPNLAQVYDAGAQAELPYVVVEHVAGVTLQEHLDTLYDNGDMLGANEALGIIDAVATFVEYAQEQGARVYSLEPANVVLTDSSAVVLQSLGMAPVEIERLTETQLAYLAPEYMWGDLSDQRAVVYGLGALLAHLLTGAAPFEGNAAAIIAQKERGRNAPRLFTHGLAPDALSLLQAARAALHPDPRQRPATVRAFRESLVGIHPTAEVLVTTLPATPEAAPAANEPAPQHVTLATVHNDETFTMPPMGDAMLVPGMERVEFQAALPFTVLVPLPAAPVEASPAPAAAPAPSAMSSGLSQHIWVLLLLAVMVSVGAAMMLG